MSVLDLALFAPSRLLCCCVLLSCQSPTGSVDGGFSDGGAVSNLAFDPDTTVPAFGAVVSGSNVALIGGGDTKAYFWSGGGLQDLWVTDGTRVGTHAIESASGKIKGADFIVGDILIGSDQGNQRWATDGVTTWTLPVPLVTLPAARVQNEKTLYVCANVAGVFQLWRTDGTQNGSKITSSLPINTVNAYCSLGAVPGGVFVRISDVTTATGQFDECWLYDSSTDSTTKLLQTNRAVVGPLAVGNSTTKRVFFTAADSLNFFGFGLVSDGTEPGTVALTSTSRTGEVLAPQSATAFVSGFAFQAAPGSSNTNAVDSLWFNDGTASGTVELTTNNLVRSIDRVLGERLGKLWFSARTPDGAIVVMSSDGTAAGTLLFEPIYASALYAIPGRVVLSGADGSWVVEGNGSREKVLDHGVFNGVVAGSVLFGTESGPAQVNPPPARLARIDGTSSGSGYLRDPTGEEVIPAGRVYGVGDAVYFVTRSGLVRVDANATSWLQLTSSDGGVHSPSGSDCSGVSTTYTGDPQYDTMCAAAACYAETGHQDRAASVCLSLTGLSGADLSRCPACVK